MENKQLLAFTRTFGCRGNVTDGEKINGMLAKMGYGFTRNQDEADLILFNTCAVRENAETRVFGNVGSLIHHKRRNRDLIVVVCGCMVQKEDTAEKLRQTFPFVDLVFGTHVIHKFPEMLERFKETRKRIIDISENHEITEMFENMPVRRESKLKADVPVMYGCDNYCSYCVVPYVRGRERSRNPDVILGEIRDLITDGVKEIMLLGQNVNSYSHGFPRLLHEIDTIPGEFRVFYMTSHPKDLSHELIDVIADSKKISHHLHLPVQSGSNRILQLMNRGYTVEQYLETIDYARKRIPKISLTTDIIVGFPGENRADFEKTLELIRKARFDSAYTFIYSKRDGTKAANLPDPISKEEKSTWFSEMLDVLDEVSGDAYSRYVGETLRVLCEGEGRAGCAYSGRSREGIIVDFNCDNMNNIGEFVDIKIKEALKWAVKGTVTKHGSN